MDCQNWIVTDNGNCEAYYPEEYVPPVESYRLYRFLTEMEDIVETIPEDYKRLQLIIPRVRTLLERSYWLQMEYSQPSPEVGWSVQFLYQEPGFPFTAQMVAWMPGQVSPIHNHAGWGVVALISGEEKNRLWQRSRNPEYKHQIEYTGERIVTPGEIIAFTPEAIHSVEPLGDEPTISFNLYGITDFSNRFEFDPVNQTAKNF
jgi:predicted metal-dependent enzyme (double-stranded beta helix superfamily)